MRDNLKGKVTVHPEQAMKAQSGHIGTAILLVLDGVRGGVIYTITWPLYPWLRGPIPIVQEAG